jgi:flagellin
MRTHRTDIHTMGLNLSAITSFGLRALADHQHTLTTTLERLSTGKQINRAADDPAGLQAATKLTAREYGLTKRLDAFGREAAFLGAQDGALSVLSDLTTQLSALTVQAANTGALGDKEREALELQAAELTKAIDHIATTSTFSTQPTLSGFTSAALAQTTIQTTDPETGEPTTETRTLANIAQLLFTDPEKAQQLAEDANLAAARRRGAVGARLQAITSESAALTEELTNTTAARSQIEDADIAKESASLVRAQLLEQATLKTIAAQREQVASLLDLLTPTTAPAPTKPTL